MMVSARQTALEVSEIKIPQEIDPQPGGPDAEF